MHGKTEVYPSSCVDVNLGIIEADLPWPKVVLMTLPGSSSLSVGKILFTAKVGNRSEARERINSFDPS